MLSDDEIRSALFASGLHNVKRTVVTRWKDGIDIDFPISEVVAFARAVERAAYERAAQACEAQISGSDHHYLATHGHWDHMAQAATNCAAAIRALGRQHD